MDSTTNRLTAIAAIDPGFFVLALHSRAEALMKASLGLGGAKMEFPNLVHAYFEAELAKPKVAARKFFDKLRLVHDHLSTNGVRHEFAQLTVEEAQGSASTFWDFLGFALAQDSAEFKDLPKLFADWTSNPWRVVASPEFQALQIQAQEWEKRAKVLLAEFDQLKARENLADKLAADLKIAQTELTRFQAGAHDKAEALKKAKQEIYDLEKSIRENNAQLAQLSELRTYLDALSRLTALTRTRRAFEEQVLRLTPEQKALAENLPVDRETMIRGGAGTGKSLVILKLVQRILEPPQGTLDYGTPALSVLLLTYTKALTKYGSYLTGLLGVKLDSVEVKTADSVLVELSKEILGLFVTYKWTTFNVVKPLIPEGPLSEAEFVAECEQLIWGWNLSWEEYRDFSRTGFKKPLKEPERKVVWDAQVKILAALTGVRNLPAPVAAQRLWEARDQWTDHQVDYVLVDEAQDLHPTKLKFFRALARRGFVLGADDNQNLNQSQSPFVRAGLDFQGKSRLLKVNFRNTVAIETTAARFHDGKTPQGAFRQGPAPEWFFAEKSEPLLDLMIAKLRILTGELHYELENILLIHSGDRSGLATRLTHERLPFQEVKDESFSFFTKGVLRLSTFPSAKGLDSPVVLALWNNVFPFPGWSEEATHRQHRNYVYVALTRALEQVNVFVREDATAIVSEMRTSSSL